MTKSADYGQFREDAYIQKRSTNHRYVHPYGSAWKMFYSKFVGQSLDDTRKYVRENEGSLRVLNHSCMFLPRQCDCIDTLIPEQRLAVPLITKLVVKSPISVSIKGMEITGSPEDIRTLLGL